MGFKENLRDELAYKGIMIKELAAMSGLNQRSISNYLRSNSSLPSVDAAVKIAQALNVSVEYLATGQEADTKQLATENQCILKYTAEIRTLADKISKMSARDRKHVAALVDSITES